MAWLLGNDQSPGAGQPATASAPRTARHGRSSSTTSFSASLAAYARAVPATIRNVPAAWWASRRRTAVHPVHATGSTSTSSSPSAARSGSEPAHEGASAAAPLSARYTDTEAPAVTRTGPAWPSPPGYSSATAIAPATSAAAAASTR